MNEQRLISFNPEIRGRWCHAPILWDPATKCTVYHCNCFAIRNLYSKISPNRDASYIKVPTAFYDALSDDEVKL
jgi:hypothetical protein